MTEYDNGGPAFPYPEMESVAGDPGMSWVDFAAIQIAAGVEACPTNHDEPFMEDRTFSQYCYLRAEALLAEKRKRENRKRPYEPPAILEETEG